MVNVFFMILYLILVSYVVADVMISSKLDNGFCKILGICIMLYLTSLGYDELIIDIRSVSIFVWVAFITNGMTSAWYDAMVRTKAKNVISQFGDLNDKVKSLERVKDFVNKK